MVWLGMAPSSVRNEVKKQVACFMNLLKMLLISLVQHILPLWDEEELTFSPLSYKLTLTSLEVLFLSFVFFSSAFQGDIFVK